jgi:hypothetical protein
VRVPPGIIFAKTTSHQVKAGGKLGHAENSPVDEFDHSFGRIGADLGLFGILVRVLAF